MHVSDPIEKINAYYRYVDASTHINGRSFAVDEKQIGEIMALFQDAPETAYQRDDVTYQGYDAIHDFFARSRVLCGTHTITSITATPYPDSAAKTIVVKGTFAGNLCSTQPTEDGHVRHITRVTPIRLNFTDFWQMQHGKVTFRESVITPLVDVARTGMGGVRI